VPNTGIYELHEGEIVVKRKIADAIRDQDTSTLGSASGGITIDGGINFLQAAIAEVDSLIAGMEKEVDIYGVDYVTDVVDRIQSELAALKDKTITLTTVHRSVYTSAGSSSANVAGSYASGTMHVPNTGIYELHEGEIVVKRKIADAIRDQDTSTLGSASGGITIEGGININLPAGVAQQSAQDWRDITRNYIIPELTAVNR